MTKTVSVKELRHNFGKIREDLAKGVSFIIIYRSVPIGELTPIQKGVSVEERKKILKKWPSFDIDVSETAEEIIRKERD